MNRLLLLGWPGATTSMVSRLLDAHRLPHLLKLVERGAIADLRRDCAGATTMTWTTVATGSRADVHGVLGDIRPRDRGTGVYWAGSADWRAPALWEFVDAADGAAAVINWPATHPAVQLRHGTCASPQFFHSPIGDPDAWLLPTNATWPPSARDELAQFRLHRSDLTFAEVRTLVPDASTIDQDLDPRLARIVVSLAANAGAHAAATHLAESQRPDLLAVHFDLLLTANETCGKTPDGSSPYARTPEEVLAFYDLMLGRYLQLLGEETSVLIVSPGWLSSSGILLAAGPDVRADVRTSHCTTLDVLPIALRLMGFDAPAGAVGRAPHEMWKTSAPKLVSLPPCERKRDEAAQGPIDHLTAARYVTAASPALSNWATRQRAVDLTQLSLVRLSARDSAGALALAEEAVGVLPTPKFVEWLARVAFMAGDFDRADAVTDRLLRSNPQSAAGNLLKAYLDHRAGRPVETSLPADKPLDKVYTGILTLLRGNTSAAIALLRDAAESMPTDAGVQHALGLALRAAGGNDAEAITALGRAAALALRPASALVHLAQTLIRTGDHPRAEQALRRALESDPNSVPIRNMLDSLLRHRYVHGSALPDQTD